MAEIKIGHPNWIGSEVGMVLKTATVNSTNAITTKNETYPDGSVHKIAKSGSVYVDATNKIYGLVYNDVDVTGDGRHASVMVAGHYIADKLPAAVASENATKFAAQGLFPVVEVDAVRPEWSNKT